MKKILIAILLTLVSSLFVMADISTDKENVKVNGQYGFDYFCRLICNNETILSIVEGKKFVYYHEGHSRFNWAIIVEDSIGYTMLGGTTSYDSMRIDRENTVHNPSTILKWGLDSMYLEVKGMEPVEKEYTGLSTRLLVFSKAKTLLLNLSDIKNFKGVDSVAFNDKYKEFVFINYLYSFPKQVLKELPTEYQKEFEDKISNMISE